MKRILIFSHAMEIGGAERALLGLLENLDYKNYQVDLFLMRHTGELLSYIPKEVNLLPEILQYTCLAVPIGNVIKKGHLLVAVGRMVGKFAAKGRVKKLQLSADNGVALECSHKYTKQFMPAIQSEIEYDLAISFLTPHYFVAEKVRAKKKIAWIHTDYTNVKVDTESELVMWNAYDCIASISENVSKGFVSVFPSLKTKIKVIENIIPIQCIAKQVAEFNIEDEMLSNGSIKLLSIGRFCTAKNFDNIPDICATLLAHEVNVKWYIIGFGGDEAFIRNKICEHNMQEHVVILGKKVNPYPYIKACDVYVQPSRYEGNCVSVHEAQLLGKPVIITKYATSSSQLEEGVDGVIVPMDNESCAKGIADVLRNPEFLKQLSANCQNRDFSNKTEVQKLYQLME